MNIINAVEPNVVISSLLVIATTNVLHCNGIHRPRRFQRQCLYILIKEYLFFFN